MKNKDTAPSELRAILKDIPEPKYTKEQKVVKKALGLLGPIDKTGLKAEDRAAIAYAGGLLESLLFMDDEEEE